MKRKRWRYGRGKHLRGMRLGEGNLFELLNLQLWGKGHLKWGKEVCLSEGKQIQRGQKPEIESQRLDQKSVVFGQRLGEETERWRGEEKQRPQDRDMIFLGMSIGTLRKTGFDEVSFGVLGKEQAQEQKEKKKKQRERETRRRRGTGRRREKEEGKNNIANRGSGLRFQSLIADWKRERERERK